jgi:SAM-dependent methyltransferase
MDSQRREDFYASPQVYDVLYTPGTAGEVDLLERIAREHGPVASGRATWLEPACGSGRYVRVLAGRGHRVIAFDHHPGMLKYARARCRARGVERRVRLFRADMDDFASRVRPRSIDLALNPVNSFRHLLTEDAAARHLRQVARSLRPGGLYLVGISFARYGREEPSEDVWQGQRGRCHVRQIVQYLPATRRRRLETVLSHIVIRRPRSTERIDSRYELRSYDEGQWKRLIRESPLKRVGAVDDQGQEVQRRELNYQIEILRH